jgi:GTP-binding protein Era
MKYSQKALNREAVNALSQADLVLMVVEANTWKRADDYILEHLRDINTKAILTVNKVDQFKDKNSILDFLKERSNHNQIIETVPVSALYNKNLARLTTVIERHLPIKTPKYKEGMITDKDTDFRITEIMRERLMHHLRDELPYSVECQLDHFEDKKKIVMIELMIKTKKPAHKKIIIGKDGKLLKVIATEARLEIENLLNKKVFLSTQVRSIKKGKSLRT